MAKGKYAPGWGPLELRDPRLKGWTAIGVAAPFGSKGALLAIEELTIGKGDFEEPALAIQVEVTTPDGGRLIHDRMLFKPKTVLIYAHPELCEYLDAIAHGKISDEFKNELEDRSLDELYNPTRTLWFSDGPRLSALEYLQCLDAARQWRELGLDGSSNETVELSQNDLRAALNTAFLAGRRVAEAEAPSNIQRARAHRAAKLRVATARKWWPMGARWAQQLVNEWPPGERLSVAALAGCMWENWKMGPLQSETVRLSPRQLEAKILPMWIASGELQLQKPHTA